MNRHGGPGNNVQTWVIEVCLAEHKCSKHGCRKCRQVTRSSDPQTLANMTVCHFYTIVRVQWNKHRAY